MYRAYLSRYFLLMLAITASLFDSAGVSTVAAADLRDAEPIRANHSSKLLVVECDPSRVDEARNDLETAGAVIVSHLAPHQWLVSGGREAILTAPGLASVRSWSSAEGVGADLRELAALPKRLAPDTVSLVVALASGSDLEPVAGRLESLDARVSWIDTTAGPVPQIGMRVPFEQIPAIVKELERTPGLVWAEPASPVRLLNHDSVWRCQSGLTGSTPIFDRGLRGEGQIIGIMDTGIDADECRFDDPVVGLPAVNDATGTEVDLDHRKVLAVDFHWAGDWPPSSSSWDNHGHGTHVAGSAAGDEHGNGLFDHVDGMAPAARLVIQDGGALTDDCADLPGLGCPVKPLEPVLEQAWIQGARLHTNSWGDEENFLPYGRYTERSADVDRFMWNHKEMLVFFAAGNSGPTNGSVISPSTAKNGVSVGASVHGDFDPTCTVVFSSRGWTRDGRIKPDVITPGMWVISAATNRQVPGPSCSDAQSSGTSMSSPTAAGLGALVRQYFADGFYPTGSARPTDAFEPTGALVKAVLISSAVDVSTLGCPEEPIPSQNQGWGLVQLDTALAFEGQSRGIVVDDHREGFQTPNDEPETMELDLAHPGSLKVVLVWTDPPSTSLADTNLINDLDLVVRGPGGVFPGNSFSGGSSVPGGEPDRLNNVEVVYLPDAGTGDWTIEVDPHALPVPGQDFALVVTTAAHPSPAPRQPSGRVAP